MTLPRRLSAIFHAYTVQNFPFAQDAVALVRGERRRWAWRLVCGIGFGVLLGFAACFLWLGSRLEIMASTMTAWHQVAETEWRQHHQPVRVSERQARGIVGAEVIKKLWKCARLHNISASCVSVPAKLRELRPDLARKYDEEWNNLTPDTGNG